MTHPFSSTAFSIRNTVKIDAITSQSEERARFFPAQALEVDRSQIMTTLRDDSEELTGVHIQTQHSSDRECLPSAFHPSRSDPDETCLRLGTLPARRHVIHCHNTPTG